MTLETEIKAEANVLGFVVSGITLPDSPPHYPQYLNWLEQGCQAGMGYMSRPDAIEARQYPQRLLPEVRSILCLGVTYPPPMGKPQSQPDSPIGTIAAYAILPDYHELIKHRLTLLSQRIEVLAGHPVRSFAAVDTSAILEKDYAQTAGLGWIDTNSCLTAPQFGSWLFLAELLLDLELNPDKPVENSDCLNCQRCVMACPTKALRPDRSLDARLCLSYLTIEHRGAIPSELRASLGTRIFGCDTCQVACPHNSRHQMNGSPYLAAPLIDPYPDLIKELVLDETQFKIKYAGTPVLRARYQGFKRNVAIALGNSGVKIAIPFLKKQRLFEIDPVVQEAMDWALTQLGSG